jgi:hypothetical protein
MSPYNHAETPVVFNWNATKILEKVPCVRPVVVDKINR